MAGNLIDTVEHVAELRLLGELVVDQFCLEGLLRRDNEESLSTSSADTAHKVVHLGSFSENVLLHVRIGSESDIVLGD